ncbi:MAG: hypothetical protein JO307_30245 [Bryobacterales bacterium]|nr:hypothetical protein [Bryobacterales bacterium]MBV9400418.1 hypothetical protein [Bryobacterales bacterium]
MKDLNQGSRAAARVIFLGPLVTLYCAAQVPVFTVTTVAGSGGPRSTANLFAAAGLAFDSTGNLYISDEQQRVFKLTPQGTLTAVAGGGPASPFLGDGGPATNAELAGPTGLAMDASGNLYIADTLDNRIRKISSSGTITTIAGGASSGPLGDGGPATSALLLNPKGLALDAAGNLYIADTGHNRVRMIAPDGTITTVAGSGVECTTGQCTAAVFGDGGPAANAAVTSPVAIALDSATNLYITDPLGFIRKVMNGVITTVAGNGSVFDYGDGGPGSAAGLSPNPQDLAVDRAGTIYISDSAHSVVRAVTSDGTINTIAGNYPATVAAFNTFPPIAAGTPALSAIIDPQALAIGPSGNLYISTINSVLSLASSAASVSPPPAVATNFGVAAIEASSFGGDPMRPISLGGWVEIYGNYLAPDTRAWAASDFNGSNAPTALDGVSVTIGGQPAYVSYISPGQVNVQVPTGIGTGPQPLVISTAHGKSPTYAITVNAEVPGLLAPPVFNIKGAQYGVALFPDGVTYALPVGAIPGVASRPAQQGDTLTFYGIGFGPTSPNISAGEITPSPNSLTQELTVWFGTPDVPATVLYAGLAPGVVGLYQFNVVVPKLPVGGAQLVIFSLGAAGLTIVTIATK